MFRLAWIYIYNYAETVSLRNALSCSMPLQHLIAGLSPNTDALAWNIQPCTRRNAGVMNLDTTGSENRTS